MKKHFCSVAALLSLSASLMAQTPAPSSRPVYLFREIGGELNYKVSNQPFKPAVSAGASLSLLNAKADTAALIQLQKSPLVLNVQGLNWWNKAIVQARAKVAGQRVIAAGLGDSVWDAVFGHIFRKARQSYEMGMLSSLGGGAGYMDYVQVTTGGTIVYEPKDSGGSQDRWNGLLAPATITRSGNVVTIKYSESIVVRVGQFITVSGATQPEYNGTFPISAISPTPPAATTGVSYTIASTPTSPATGSLMTYGAIADYKWLPGANHYELGQDGYIEGHANYLRGVSQWKACFVSGPGQGTVLVTMSDYDSNTLISSQTVDLSGSSFHLKTVTFTPANTQAVRIRSTRVAGVVNHLLTAAFLDNNGVGYLNYARGGSAVKQQCKANTTIFRELLEEVGVSLMTISCKEEGLATGSLDSLATKISSLTGISYLVIGTQPDASLPSKQLADNAKFRDWAIPKGMAYVDGYNAIPGPIPIRTIKAMKLYGGGLAQNDSTHVESGGLPGNIMWNLLPDMDGPYEKRVVNNAEVTTDNLYVKNNDAVSQKTLIASRGTLDQARLFNIQELNFGAAGNSQKWVPQGTADIVAQRPNGSGGVTFANIKGANVIGSGNAQFNRYIGNGTASLSSVGAAAGTGATVTVAGSPTGHAVTVTTGTSPTTGIVATINISAGGYGSMPFFAVTPYNHASTAHVQNGSPLAYSLYVDGTLAANTTYVFHVIIIGAN